MLAWVALGWPLVAPLSGRPWAQAEVVALAPDPMAVAKLAVLCWPQRFAPAPAHRPGCC